MRLTLRFQEALRRLRRAKDFTQEELAARAGLSVRHYQLLETGDRIDPERLCCLNHKDSGNIGNVMDDISSGAVRKNYGSDCVVE